VQFYVHSLRFGFLARDAVRFAVGKPGNILRGALGALFHRMFCDPDCPGAGNCQRQDDCVYARLFEPSALSKGPSGLADWPRPFVFRAGHLDGGTAHAGDSFHFDLHIFEMNENVIPHFVLAFAQLAREGLGPQRGRAELQSVHQLDRGGLAGKLIYDGGDRPILDPASPLAFDLRPPEQPLGRLRVRFVTPTELKAGKRIAERPEFPILFARARDRVSTLRALYQGGPLEIDFIGIGRRASAVKMTRCEIQRRDIMRRSTKTGQVHPIGGFVGEAEYEGELSEFYPFLHAAQWTGVGRHTVWGKGAIVVD
jgi:hypothetical protein